METKKILIVDDDIDVITVLSAILKKEGFEVISANDKIDGIKKAWTNKPDLSNTWPCSCACTRSRIAPGSPVSTPSNACRSR